MQLEAKVVTESIKNVKTQIEKISRSCEEYAHLQTIPGLGPYVSAVVLAAIGNPHRFENVQQLKRLAGFDLNASRSGKRSGSAVPVISKKGKGDLRYALYQAALVASSLTRQFRAYYHKILKGREREKGIRTKMRVKLASKFLVIAWTLMKKKEPFSASYLKL
jgi:transposase